MKARRRAKARRSRVLAAAALLVALAGLSTISFADVSAYRPGPQQLRIGGQSASVLAPDAGAALPPLPSPSPAVSSTASASPASQVGTASASPVPEESASGAGAPPIAAPDPDPGTPAADPGPGYPMPDLASAVPVTSAPGDPEPVPVPTVSDAASPACLRASAVPVAGSPSAAEPVPPTAPSALPSEAASSSAPPETDQPVRMDDLLASMLAIRFEPPTADTQAQVLLSASGADPVIVATTVALCPDGASIGRVDLPPDVRTAAAGRAVGLSVLNALGDVVAIAAWPGQVRCTPEGAGPTPPASRECAGTATLDRPITVEDIAGTRWVFEAVQ